MNNVKLLFKTHVALKQSDFRKIRRQFAQTVLAESLCVRVFAWCFGNLLQLKLIGKPCRCILF